MAQVARSLREPGIAAKAVVVYRKTINGDCFAQMRLAAAVRCEVVEASEARTLESAAASYTR